MEEFILQFQQNITATIHDLKMQVGQLADTVSQIESETKSRVDSQMQQSAKSVLLPFPNRTVSTKRSEIDEDLLKLFRKVEINIPQLNAYHPPHHYHL
ncbi:hypothetical protein CR513_40369, partial [Mucuna pruriens]